MIQTNPPIKVYYIYHSGFLAETPQVYYLFDYYKGNLPALDKAKPIFVFASHGHKDHYNPEIFSLLLSMGMETIMAVLANDIPAKRYPSCLLEVPWVAQSPQTAPGSHGAQDSRTAQIPHAAPEALDDARSQGFIPAVRARHSREYALPFHTRLQTLLSTDSGAAYLITCPQGTIYHAGDLNDWITEETPEQERRQMHGSYMASINKLKGRTIDVAFLPLDPRLGKHYADGFLAFLKTADVKRAYPMHFWEQPEITAQFLREHPEYAETVAGNQ